MLLKSLFSTEMSGLAELLKSLTHILDSFSLNNTLGPHILTKVFADIH